MPHKEEGDEIGTKNEIHPSHPDGFSVEVSDGTWDWNATQMRIDYFTPQDGEIHTVRISPP